MATKVTKVTTREDDESPLRTKTFNIPPDHPMHGIFGKMLEDGTPYVSPSQVMTLLSCPAKWKFGYLEGIKGPTDDNLLLGSAVHAAMESALIDTLALQPVEALQLERDAIQYIQENKDKPWVVLEEDPNVLANQAATLAKELWLWFIKSDLSPVSMETEVVVRNDGFAELGYYDLLAKDKRTGKLVLVDWKTAAKSPSMNEDDTAYILDRKHAHALLRYADALQQDGKQLHAVMSVTVTKTKVPKVCPAILYLNDKHGKEMIEWSRAVTAGAVNLIRNKTLGPNPTSWMCSEHYCAAYKLCPGSGAHLGA